MDRNSRAAAIGALIGFAAGVGTAYVVYKINKEIEAMPSETGSYKEKAAKWLEIKKDNIKNAVEVKRQQIKDIADKAKEALLSEESAEKRKEIMDKASKQIAAIKKEIQAIISKGSKEVSALAKKISNAEMFVDVSEFFSSLKKQNADIVDVDYTFESEYDEYFGDDAVEEIVDEVIDEPDAGEPAEA